MTPNEYLKALLDSQKLRKDELDELTKHREEVEAALQKELGSGPAIRYGGSKAKHTMIRESYDLDILCYFPPEEERTLKEIYQAVSGALGKKYVLQPKASAVRILSLKPTSGTGGANGDYHVDVVPGRYIDNKGPNVFIYVSDGEAERMQTNIQTHVDYISVSECREVIKLTKLWRCRHKLPGRTFVFETFVVEELKGSRTKDDIEKSMLAVLEGLRDRVESVRLVDPANTNNVVSDLISEGEKKLIAGAARDGLASIANNSENPVQGWKTVFSDYSAVKESREPAKIEPPRRPWSE